MMRAHDRIAQSWDENAGAWTNAVRSGALESRRLVTDRAIIDAVLGHPGQRVLDVGCGEGWLARQLADAGRDVTGFDASAELIAQARQTGGARFSVLTYDGFAAEPQRVGDAFDLAVCNFSLLGSDIAALLHALRRIIIADGHLLIQTVHPVTVSAGLPYEDGWREEDFQGLAGEWSPMPWYFRTFSSWVRELRSSGWQLHNCTEPLHPITKVPASVIFDARRSQSDGINR